MKYLLSLDIKRQAKNDICFEHEEEYALDNKILGIFGESGTGKSTLLKALAGLVPEAEYSLSVDGEVFKNTPAANNPCVYVGHDSVLFEHLSAQENLSLVTRHSASSARRRLDEQSVIELCKIKSVLKQRVSALSSGEKQRVQFARALLSGKSIILLDEAFSSLDWSARVYFFKLVKQLAQEHQLRFIMVSHSLQELALCCTDIWVLELGRFILQDDVDTVLNALLLGNKQALLNETSQNIGVQQKVFSLLHLVYKGKDSLDQSLEHWQLPQVDEQSAQLLFKKAATHSVTTNMETKNSSASIIIEADKISLSKEKLTHSSMVNCLKGSVSAIDQRFAKNHDYPEGIVVSLDVNGQTLRSAITKRSFVDMQIEKGDTLFAIFKAL